MKAKDENAKMMLCDRCGEGIEFSEVVGNEIILNYDTFDGEHHGLTSETVGIKKGDKFYHINCNIN